MKDQHVNVFYSEDDEGYIAAIPDLQSCSAFGDTPEEALQPVQMFRHAEELGMSHGPPPAPPGRPTLPTPGWRPQDPHPATPPARPVRGGRASAGLGVAGREPAPRRADVGCAPGDASP